MNKGLILSAFSWPLSWLASCAIAGNAEVKSKCLLLNFSFEGGWGENR